MKSKELTGRVACEGFIGGKVHLAKPREPRDSSKKDYILVARHSSPEYAVMAFGAKAIVTDNGGAMSHLAVVSRELGIPCVVGTGKATETYEEGELIEVDARDGFMKEGRVYSQEKD